MAKRSSTKSKAAKPAEAKPADAGTKSNSEAGAATNAAAPPTFSEAERPPAQDGGAASLAAPMSPAVEAAASPAAVEQATALAATHIRITARKASRRRAGMDFGRQPVTLAIADLTAEQLAALKGDPALIVEEVAADAAAA
jgi:hypothetical protein